ncbi:MAG: hypothetical protein AB7R89_00250 [Dehalococcoidia bacterium]
MAIRSESTDDQIVLRQVVAEIRWLLAHSAGVRADLIRLVRRYEDALYPAPARGRSSDDPTIPPVTPDRILRFPRSRVFTESITASTNTPGDSA